MIRLFKVAYVLRGVAHEHVLSRGDAVRVADLLRKQYPGIDLEVVEVYA